MTEAPTEPAADTTTAVEVIDTATVPAIEPDASANAEAARYRTRAREAELARDGANARVEALQRREATSLVANRLAVPTDLFDVGGVTVADMSTDGEIDPAKVTAAVTALLDARPGLAKVAKQLRGPSANGLGNRGGKVGVSGPTWPGVLRGQRT